MGFLQQAYIRHGFVFNFYYNRSVKKLLLVSQFSTEILKKYFYQKLENTECCHQVLPTYFSL